jgi:hypothetical protein
MLNLKPPRHTPTLRIEVVLTVVFARLTPLLSSAAVGTSISEFCSQRPLSPSRVGPSPQPIRRRRARLGRLSPTSHARVGAVRHDRRWSWFPARAMAPGAGAEVGSAGVRDVDPQRRDRLELPAQARARPAVTSPCWACPIPIRRPRKADSHCFEVAEPRRLTDYGFGCWPAYWIRRMQAAFPGLLRLSAGCEQGG